MIHIDYDNDTSDEEKEATTTSTTTSTVSTIASTTVSNTIPTTAVTSVVPQYIQHAYHQNPINDDRLRTWFKLLWNQQVYQENLNRLGIEHVLPTWYPYLRDYVRMENTDPEWNYVIPRNPPLAEGMTPIEQLFDWAPTNYVNDCSRVTGGEILALTLTRELKE
jgi:hypothetical protein